MAPMPTIPLPIDLRSDTVTRPTPAMREAMRNAEVGDDVYGEDPTVNCLEARAAEMLGREAALLVPTGTMGNQIALAVHLRPGQEIICEARAHIFNYEMAMPAVLAGGLIRPATAADGKLTWPCIEPHLRLDAPYHKARTGLIVVENTLNLAGGVVLGQTESDAICQQAHDLQLPVHLDGARIFNAAAALHTPVAALSRGFDSVMFCLSKGLGAPVGSLLAGSREFIHQARILRKRLGGGMRQAGILAAAGLLALEDGPAQLPRDHVLARELAEGLAQLPGIGLDPGTVETNILIFDTQATGRPAAVWVRDLAAAGVLCGAAGPHQLRWVTHRDVSPEQGHAALAILRRLL